MAGGSAKVTCLHASRPYVRARSMGLGLWALRYVGVGCTTALFPRHCFKREQAYLYGCDLVEKV